MNDQPKPRRLLPLAAVERRVGLRKTAIYDGINAGWFPKPVKMGTTSRWVESEIDALIESLIKDRDQAA